MLLTSDVVLVLGDGRVPVGPGVVDLGQLASVVLGQVAGRNVFVQGGHLRAVEEHSLLQLLAHHWLEDRPDHVEQQWLFDHVNLKKLKMVRYFCCRYLTTALTVLIE